MLAYALFSDLPIDMINRVAYMNGVHRHLFTVDNLLLLLEDAEFDHAMKRDFDPDIDVPVRRAESIYACAIKNG